MNKYLIALTLLAATTVAAQSCPLQIENNPRISYSYHGGIVYMKVNNLSSDTFKEVQYQVLFMDDFGEKEAGGLALNERDSIKAHTAKNLHLGGGWGDHPIPFVDFPSGATKFTVVPVKAIGANGEITPFTCTPATGKVHRSF